MEQDADGLVDSNLVGEVWTTARPGTDPVLYGHVMIEPKGPFAARSLQTFRLTYTVGRFGLDDTGAIRVMLRAMGDGGALQTDDPTVYNYVTATTSSGVPLGVEYSRHGTMPRPRWKTLTVRVSGGFLREGDRIEIVLGDTLKGSPGLNCNPWWSRISNSRSPPMSAPWVISRPFPIPPTLISRRGRRRAGAPSCPACAVPAKLSS